MSGNLTIVRASGNPEARGRAVGTALREQIGRSVEFYRRYFDRRGVGPRELQRLTEPFISAAESVLPAHVAVLRGMAEAADAPFEPLFAANAFEDVDPLVEAAPARSRVERCSAFVVVTPETTILAHDEQWFAGDARCIGVVIDDPGDGEIPVASPTVASWLPAVGVNARGGAQAVMSLVASDDAVGVPRALVSRHALGAADRADAVRRTALPGRGGGYAYLVAFPGEEPFLIETTATLQAVLEGPRAHANHYVDPTLSVLGEAPSPGSLGRHERLRSLVREHPPSSAEDAMRLLGDHEASPEAVCLHADPTEDEEAEAVLFAMVCDVGAGRMWVASGNPCETPFREIDLAALRRG